MPARTEQQRKLMGWAYACKIGKSKNCPPHIKKIASEMSEEDLADFAKSIKESDHILTFEEFVSYRMND